MLQNSWQPCGHWVSMSTNSDCKALLPVVARLPAAAASGAEDAAASQLEDSALLATPAGVPLLPLYLHSLQSISLLQLSSACIDQCCSVTNVLCYSICCADVQWAECCCRLTTDVGVHFSPVIATYRKGTLPHSNPQDAVFTIRDSLLGGQYNEAFTDLRPQLQAACSTAPGLQVILVLIFVISFAPCLWLQQFLLDLTYCLGGICMNWVILQYSGPPGCSSPSNVTLLGYAFSPYHASGLRYSSQGSTLLLPGREKLLLSVTSAAEVSTS